MTVGPGLVAVPATDFVWTEAAASLFGLMANAPAGTRLDLQCGGTTIAEKRALSVKVWLAQEPALEWVLFCDSDMVVPADAIRRLAAHNVEIVAGLYVERRPRANGVYPISAGFVGEDGMMTSITRVDGSVQRVHVVGFGCVFVRRSVFERVAAPWFRCNQLGVNEDWDFCFSARDAGIPVHVDTSLRVGHMTGKALHASGNPAIGQARMLGAIAGHAL